MQPHNIFTILGCSLAIYMKDPEQPFVYTVLLDAGSVHTSVFVYRWDGYYVWKVFFGIYHFCYMDVMYSWPCPHICFLFTRELDTFPGTSYAFIISVYMVDMYSCPHIFFYTRELDTFHGTSSYAFIISVILWNNDIDCEYPYICLYKNKLDTFHNTFSLAFTIKLWIIQGDLCKIATCITFAYW